MKNVFPKSVSELVSSPWFPKLRTLVSNFHLNEPVEDTLNDILLDMMEKNYLSRWNANHGSYSNWIYTFASNICKKKYNRSNTRGGRALERAASIQVSADDENDTPIGIFFEETLDINILDRDSSDYALLCAEINAILSKYPAHSSNTYQGIVYPRDMKTTFNLLKQELQPKEIAELFGTSVEFIYTLIRRMRPIIASVL